MLDPEQFITALSQSDIRVLLIGRRALVALGAALLTADYDLWVHIDDIELLNTLAAEHDLVPTHDPRTARTRGRYVLENDERVDVIVARTVSTSDGKIRFDDLWSDRQYVELDEGIEACLPSLEGLILTKRIASRPKDIEDIRFLELLLARETDREDDT